MRIIVVRSDLYYLLLGIVGLFFTLAGRTLAEPMLSHVDVFTSGSDGYHTFRIPCLLTTPDGSLLAFAEARKYNDSDPGHKNNDIDLVLRRSTDQGKTWSKLYLIEDPGEKWSACNPVAVVDRTSGRVWLHYARTKPDRSSLTSRPGTDDAQNFVRFSDDNGLTWSPPRNITQIARDVDAWGGVFSGPGGGIQNRAGRLIIPMSRTTGKTTADGKPVAGPWNAFAVYSDDHGQSWVRGELLPQRDWGDENQLVELADGRILMNLRQDEGLYRLRAASRDGGQTWDVPVASQAMNQVACSIERYSLQSLGADRNRILWTGPKGPRRRNLVVRVSYDEGQSFTVERPIGNQYAAYSDMAILKDNTVGVLWERGVDSGYQFITFSRFNLEYLESPAPGL